jgi:predicted peptidase
MPQTAHTFAFTPSVSYPYLRYLPESYGRQPARRWPLIIFLHGSGERGDDPSLLKRFALPQWLETQPDFPAVVVSPQCPADTRWQAYEAALEAFLLMTISSLAVVPTRIYLTGISMGGQGAWYWGARHPEHFAAILPICGRIPEGDDFPRAVCALKATPVWVFHGARDDRVPITHSDTLVATLHACGGDVRYTVLPEADHLCWDAVYPHPAWSAWLLAQVKST